MEVEMLIISMCLYLSRKVVEAEHKSPVKISFPSQGVEVDVSLLFFSFQSLYPAAQRTEWNSQPSEPRNV